MKAAFLCSLVVASAAAFAPQQQRVVSSTTALNEFVRGYVGGEGPEPMFIGENGSKNFDPAGLSEVGVVFLSQYDYCSAWLARSGGTSFRFFASDDVALLPLTFMLQT